MSDRLPTPDEGGEVLHPGAGALLRAIGQGGNEGQRDEVKNTVRELPVTIFRSTFSEAGVPEHLRGTGKTAAAMIRMKSGNRANIIREYPSFESLPADLQVQMESGSGWHEIATQDAKQWDGEHLSHAGALSDELQVSDEFRGMKGLLVPIDTERSVLLFHLPSWQPKKHDESRRAPPCLSIILPAARAEEIYALLQTDAANTVAAMARDMHPAIADQFDFPSSGEIEIALARMAPAIAPSSASGADPLDRGTVRKKIKALDAPPVVLPASSPPLRVSIPESRPSSSDDETHRHAALRALRLPPNLLEEFFEADGDMHRIEQALLHLNLSTFPPEIYERILELLPVLPEGAYFDLDAEGDIVIQRPVHHAAKKLPTLPPVSAPTPSSSPTSMDALPSASAEPTHHESHEKKAGRITRIYRGLRTAMALIGLNATHTAIDASLSETKLHSAGSLVGIVDNAEKDLNKKDLNALMKDREAKLVSMKTMEENIAKEKDEKQKERFQQDLQKLRMEFLQLEKIIIKKGGKLMVATPDTTDTEEAVGYSVVRKDKTLIITPPVGKKQDLDFVFMIGPKGSNVKTVAAKDNKDGTYSVEAAEESLIRFSLFEKGSWRDKKVDLK